MVCCLKNARLQESLVYQPVKPRMAKPVERARTPPPAFLFPYSIVKEPDKHKRTLRHQKVVGFRIPHSYKQKERPPRLPECLSFAFELNSQRKRTAEFDPCGDPRRHCEVRIKPIRPMIVNAFLSKNFIFLKQRPKQLFFNDLY